MHRIYQGKVTLAMSTMLALAGCDEKGSSWNPADYPLSFGGTMDIDYSFLDQVTYQVYSSPPNRYANAIVAPNSDFSTITVETAECYVVGDLVSVDSDDGERRYQIDLALSDCNETANGSSVLVDFDDNLIVWSSTGLSFLMSGDASIPNATSLILFYYEGN